MACSNCKRQMWERLRRFSALERPAQALFLRAIVLLPLVSVNLRRRGFKATQAALQKRIGAVPANPDPRKIAAMSARMVHAAVRHGFGHPTCLQESLVLWYLLARQGIDSELRIGIRKHAGKFEAHAWVECQGAAINEPEALHEHYAAFDAGFSAPPPEQP